MTTNSPRAYMVLQTAKTKKLFLQVRDFLVIFQYLWSIAMHTKRMWQDFAN